MKEPSASGWSSTEEFHSLQQQYIGWKETILYQSVTCGRGQDRLVRQRSLQSCPHSQEQRSPSSGPDAILLSFDFSNTQKNIARIAKLP